MRSVLLLAAGFAVGFILMPMGYYASGFTSGTGWVVSMQLEKLGDSAVSLSKDFHELVENWKIWNKSQNEKNHDDN